VRIQFNHVMGVSIIVAALTPFAMCSVLSVGWEKTLGCLLVGVALALSSLVLAIGVAIFRGE